MSIKKKAIALIATTAIVASTATGCASIERFTKTVVSDTTGGLDRHVIAYTNTGEVLGEWEGKIDIQENNSGTKVLFDLDGKRIVLYNAIVVVEEI